MLQTTKGIVLRSVKYGDSSLVTTIFTAAYGAQAYMVQGVRSSKARNNRAGLLQPATLLDLVVYQNPQKKLQRIREFQPAYIYNSLQEEIVKNSVALFSVELLLRLLPEQAPMPELFDFCFEYFVQLDKMPIETVANFPLYFIIQCSSILGYTVKGTYSDATPHLDLGEGSFSSNSPAQKPFVSDEDARALTVLMYITQLNDLKQIEMNSTARYRLLEWYLEFLQRHTDHLGAIRSLAVLQAVLH